MPEVLDEGALQTLLGMVGHDPAFVDELVDAYLADVPEQLVALRAALEAGDAGALVRPAHTLKGTSLTLGGARVAELARQIEQHGRDGSTDTVAERLDELEAAQTDLVAALAIARVRRWSTP
jgi:HPt (histidine-containing phosphotransfer) domain-containing protein